MMTLNVRALYLKGQKGQCDYAWQEGDLGGCWCSATTLEKRLHHIPFVII